MRAAKLIAYSAATLTASFVVLTGVHGASAAPLPTSTASVRAAAPAELAAVGYIVRDGDGVLFNGAGGRIRWGLGGQRFLRPVVLPAVCLFRPAGRLRAAAL